MKKLFYLFMVAMCATMFSACSDDDKDPLDDNGEGKEGVITIVCEEDYSGIHLGVETFKEGEIVTVDWGDGNVEEFKSIKLPEGFGEDWDDYDVWPEFGEQTHYAISTDYSVEHEYSSNNPHHITIKGNIKGVISPYRSTSLDVSKCTALTYLHCGIELTSLDVSKNTALTHLCCDANNLTSLDVSKNTKLTHLYCSYMKDLTSLDVSGCTALTVLDCSSNNLTSLDVSKCTALTELDCGGNELTSLDVSKCTALTHLCCDANNLTSLDVSKNTALTELWCGNNNLTSLDVSKNTALTELWCGNNNLSSAALNQIFRDLPQGKKLEDYPYQSEIRIYGNPGDDTCDKSIAEKKGWKVW